MKRVYSRYLSHSHINLPLIHSYFQDKALTHPLFRAIRRTGHRNLPDGTGAVWPPALYAPHAFKIALLIMIPSETALMEGNVLCPYTCHY